MKFVTAQRSHRANVNLILVSHIYDDKYYHVALKDQKDALLLKYLT